MRKVTALMALALTLSACTQTPPDGGGAGVASAGGIAGIAQGVGRATSPSVTLGDTEFESLIARADLRKTFGSRADEILDQIRSTRVAVATALRPKSSSQGGRRQASVFAGFADYAFMAVAFQIAFRDLLDPLTKSGTPRETRPSPESTTAEGPSTRTTTSLNTSSQSSATGSRVTLSMHWTYKTTTVDRATGATLFELNDDRTMVGAIDVCPDASGTAKASLDVHVQGTATKGGISLTQTTTTSNQFSGRVDDQAFLRGVVQDFSDRSSWTTESGAGGFNATASFTWGAGESGVNYGSSAITPGAPNSLETTGDADAARSGLISTVGSDALALDAAWKEAQRLWRNGRCVVVAAPDYDAETPIEIADQEKTRHTEEVAPGSETKFTAQLRHRFGGGLSQPIDAALIEGDRKLQPAQLSALPGSLSYTASDELDKHARARLRSMSKRGIGTLVLAFDTTANLTLGMQGTLGITTNGPFGSMDGTVTISPAEFHRNSAGRFEATAAARAKLTGMLPGCVVSASETATVGLIATIEKRGDTSVWVVHPDDTRSTSDVSFTMCGYAFPGESPGGGAYATTFVSTVADCWTGPCEIVIPVEGGNLPLHGTHTIAAGGFTVTHKADGTAQATVKK